jgi:hypothetical protein
MIYTHLFQTWIACRTVLALLLFVHPCVELSKRKSPSRKIRVWPGERSIVTHVTFNPIKHFILIKWLVNKMDWTWEKAVVAYFKVLSCHLRGGTEKNTKNVRRASHRVIWIVKILSKDSRLRFKPTTSRMRFYSIVVTRAIPSGRYCTSSTEIMFSCCLFLHSRLVNSGVFQAQ